jgi:hypothetical protein
MIGILIAWGIGAFVYFKVAFDAAFRADISIVAAFLLAVFVAGIVFAASGLYAARLLHYNWSPGTVKASAGELIRKSFGLFLLIYISYAIISRIIIFGFSKRLSSEIDVFSYKYEPSDEVLSYLFITILPVALHYAMCIFATYRNTRSSPGNEPE